MSNVIIRGFAQSSYVMTVRFAAGEKGLDVTFEPVSPGDAKIAEGHPYKKVPSLEHGDVKLYESAAICRYIDEAFDGPALQPGTPAERAKMQQFISNVNCYLYPHSVPRYMLQYIFPSGPEGKPNRDKIDKAVPLIEHDLSVFDAAYGDGPFLVGDSISLADCFVAPLYAGLSRFPEGEAMLGKFPKVAQALGALASRDAFKATLPG